MRRRMLFLWVMLLGVVSSFAQSTVQFPTSGTIATEQWVQNYLFDQLEKLGVSDCDLKAVDVAQDGNAIEFGLTVATLQGLNDYSVRITKGSQVWYWNNVPYIAGERMRLENVPLLDSVRVTIRPTLHQTCYYSFGLNLGGGENPGDTTVVTLPTCPAGPTLLSISEVSNTGLRSQFHGDGVTILKWAVLNASNDTLRQAVVSPTSSIVNISYASLYPGNYRLAFIGQSCTGSSSLNFVIPDDGTVIPDPDLPNCSAGPTILSVSSITANGLTTQFHGEDVFQIKWTILSGSTAVRTSIVSPTSSVINIAYSTLAPGAYTLRLDGQSCNGSSTYPFTVPNAGTVTPPDPGNDIAVVGTYSVTAGGRKWTFSKTVNFSLLFNSDGTISDATSGLNSGSTPNQLDGQNVFYQIGYYPLVTDGDGARTYKPLQNVYLPDGAYSIWQVKANAGKFPNMASYIANISGWDNDNGVNRFNASLEVINVTVRTLADPKIPNWLQATRVYQMGKYGEGKQLRNDKSFGLFRKNYTDITRSEYHARGIHTYLEFGPDRNQPNTVKTFEWPWNGLPLFTNSQLYDYGRGMARQYGLNKLSLITDQIPENTQGTDQTIFDRMYNFYNGLLDLFKETDPTITKVQTGLYGPYGQDRYTGFFSHGLLESQSRSFIAESLDSHRFDERNPSTGAWRGTVNSYFASGQVNVRNMNFDLYMYNDKLWQVPYEIMYAWERQATATKTYEGIDRQSKMIVYSTSITQSLVGGASSPTGLEYTIPGEIIPFPGGELRATFSMAANISEYYDAGFWSTFVPNGIILWSTNQGGTDATKIDHYFGDSSTPGTNMYWTPTGGSSSLYSPGSNGAPLNDYSGLPDHMLTMPDDVAYLGYQDARNLLGYADKVYYASYTSSRKSFTASPGSAGYHVNGFGSVNIGVGLNLKDAIDGKKGLALFGTGSSGKIAVYYNGFLSKHEYEENVQISHEGTTITIPGRVYGRKTYWVTLPN